MAEPPGGVLLGGGGLRGGTRRSSVHRRQAQDGQLDLDGVPEREGGKGSKEREAVPSCSRWRSAWAGREGNTQQQEQEEAGGGGLVRGVEDASAG